MRKIAIVLTLALGLSLTSCSAGPHQLSRSVDDWNHQMYVDNPWLNGILHFVPVMPIIGFGAGIVDFFVTDAWAFWGNDAWDQKGTGFVHKKVAHTDGAMTSLLENGKFLEMK